MISLDIISYLFDFLFGGDHLLATLFLIHSAYMIRKLFLYQNVVVDGKKVDEETVKGSNTLHNTLNILWELLQPISFLWYILISYLFLSRVNFRVVSFGLQVSCFCFTVVLYLAFGYFGDALIVEKLWMEKFCWDIVG